MKSRLAAPDALYVKPLVFGLDRTDSPFELVADFPAINALKLSERSGGIRNAFLSPIDYARHSGDYRIVPNVCAASTDPTGTIQLVLKSNLHNIETVAIDVRFSSEIILAKIILSEKYRSEPEHTKLQFIPMMPDVDAMLTKADAALVVQDYPGVITRPDTFTLDLVEEWSDLTGLPYIHGFWVGREEDLSGLEAQALITAKNNGVPLKPQIARDAAQWKNGSIEEFTKYVSAFSYNFGEKEEESLSEFMHYAYYHGIIGDVPDILYFETETTDPDQN